MKKIKIYILFVLTFLAMALEFIWSILTATVNVIGEKITELADATESVYQKAKN